MYKRPVHRRVIAGIVAFPLVVGLCVLLFPSKAHAYLYPGTGSLILQAVAGAILALVLTFKLWWFRVIQLVSKLFGSTEEDAE